MKVNLPNQWYRPDLVGMNKTDALWDILHDFTGVELKAHDRHYDKDPLRGLVISCVDSMDARLKIWTEVKKYRPDLYLDSRMGAEVGKVLVVTPSDPTSCRKYEEDLYPSTEALHAPCTAKATIYCAAGLAAYVGAIVGAYVNGRKVEGVVVDWRLMTVVRGGGGKRTPRPEEGCVFFTHDLVYQDSSPPTRVCSWSSGPP